MDVPEWIPRCVICGEPRVLNAGDACTTCQPEDNPPAMYSRIVVEIVFPSEDLGRNTVQLHDVLRDGLGNNYVAHCYREKQALTEDECEDVLGSMHGCEGY